MILGGPLGFRATCYYYRKAYYRAFFLDPPACAVGEAARHDYRGETAFPLILQNLHRYFLYVALIFLVILWYDAIRAFWFDGRFGIGVGSLGPTRQHRSALALHVFLSLAATHRRRQRRLFFLRRLRRSATHGLAGLSFLNEHHMLFAWLSLFSVGLADLYVRWSQAASIQDLRLL